MNVISRTSVCLEHARTFQGCSAVCVTTDTNWTAVEGTVRVSVALKEKGDETDAELLCNIVNLMILLPNPKYTAETVTLSQLLNLISRPQNVSLS